MKPISLKVFIQRSVIALLAVSLLIAMPALGDYEISWSTIDGGGGRSSGGDYTLVATIGQPEAGAVSGGSYELLGGFWPGGPLCFVGFDDFARFAEHWLDTGTELAGDLDADNDVDSDDLRLFVEQWLYSCPYNWPLR